MPKWEKSRYLDQELINKALVFATRIHQHQKRKNGEPYIIHPIAVANILFEIGVGADLIAVGLLHDTLEDALDKEKTHHEMQNEFNSHIYTLVKALTKTDYETDEITQNNYFQQIIDASRLDIGVIFVKVADLLHNLSTIENLKPIKREKWLNELIEGYLPILKNAYEQMTPSYKKNYDRLMDKLADNLSSLTQS